MSYYPRSITPRLQGEMPELQQRQELADFLKTRRYRINPEEAAMSRTGRRRTPGLRREEVAILSGISPEWYTWLEQGRDIQASQETLQRIAATLRLEPSETAYLLRLAGYQPTKELTQVVAVVSPQLQRMLDQLEFTPAYILGRRWDIMAWNDAATLIFGDFSSLHGVERNCMWQTFMGSMRSLMVDWEKHAKVEVDTFRGTRVQYSGDPWVEEFIAALKEASPEFRTWWSQHDVQDWNAGIKHFEHPRYGRLSFEHTAFQIADQNYSELRLMVYVPLLGTDTRTKLEEMKRTRLREKS